VTTPTTASAAPEPTITFEELPPVSRGGTWLCTWGKWDECKERCEAKNALSCARLGLVLLRGDRDPITDRKLDADPPKAREALQKSCDLGYARGCAVLGVLLAEGKGGDKDEARARGLFETACGAGDAVACTNLASSTQDEAKARPFYKRACDLGDPMACVEVGASKSADDLKSAFQSFRRALHEAPTASPRAAKLLHCPEGSVPVATLSVVGGLGGPTMYCASKAGQREGPYIEWASEEDAEEGPEHGMMRESGAYHADKREGHFKRFFEDGRLRSEGDYKDDLEEGAWEIRGSYSGVERGSFSRGKREGAWIEEDSHARNEGRYKAGKRDGVWTEYLGGEKFQESSYVDGELDGPETRKWPNGEKCVDHYARGMREGLFTCFHANGRKSSESRWHENKQIGETQRWDAQGRPQ
jgi:antitoxin component YwqK of YwqJK toxin-antitoxin module